MLSWGLGNSRGERCCQSGSLERLNLTFLVDTKHDRFVRRIEIKSYNIVELLAELFVFAEFERFDKMRLQVVVSPNAGHRGLADTLILGHRPRAPVSGVGWFAV